MHERARCGMRVNYWDPCCLAAQSKLSSHGNPGSRGGGEEVRPRRPIRKEGRQTSLVSSSTEIEGGWLEKARQLSMSQVTSRRQSRNARVTEAYVMQKRLASDDRSALECMERSRRRQRKLPADEWGLQDELSTAIIIWVGA